VSNQPGWELDSHPVVISGGLTYESQGANSLAELRRQLRICEGLFLREKILCLVLRFVTLSEEGDKDFRFEAD
jgi:hypothetical protein